MIKTIVGEIGMSKIAEYLQEHIEGEIITQPTVLDAMSRDASVLHMKPDMVVYPRFTSDIRKVARFTWQLAEKGTVLPITARGGGTDETGAAIGKGIILATQAHMNAILEFDPKQKLIRVQPGLNAKALADALTMHGMALPALPLSSAYSTVGGAVANNSSGLLSPRYGDMRAWAAQLEVVLANGDILQTERINKRELARRKGLQTLEGEIYRAIDGLIEDNKELITEQIGADTYDSSGFSAIAKVKQRDGSFDLTPLIVGSQGTLGIVSEMILKADFVNTQLAVVAAAFTSKEAAHDMADQLQKLEPAMLDYYDGQLFEIAAAAGCTYPICKALDGPVRAMLVIGFNDYSERARHKKIKRAEKLLEQAECTVESGDGNDALRLMALREVTAIMALPAEPGASAPPLLGGAYIPRERQEDFARAVALLADKQHVSLPLHISMLDNIIHTRPVLHLQKVGDKQKVLKLLDEYGTLVADHAGVLVAQGGDGRLKTRFAYSQLDTEVSDLYAAVKSIFDPYGTLNPGVKQTMEVRQLVAHLRPSYDISSFTGFVPYW